MKRTCCSFLLTVLTLVFLNGVNGQTITFTGEELIGKPTDHSIAINIIPASTIEVFYEYGTSPGYIQHKQLQVLQQPVHPMKSPSRGWRRIPGIITACNTAHPGDRGLSAMNIRL